MQGSAYAGTMLSTGQFQPAPPVKSINEAQAIHRNTRNFLIIFGSFLLALVVIIPLWDAGLMLEDPIYVFFLGKDHAQWIIITCCSAIVIWILMVALFFGGAREEAHTQTSMVSLVCILLTGLGVALLIQSNMMITHSRIIINDLVHNCGTSRITHNLTAYSTALQVLRQQENCIGMESIVECQGYENSPPWTGILKTMENYLQCSGFGYVNHNVTGAGMQSLPVSLVEGTSSSLSLRVKQASHRLKTEESMMISKHRYEHFEITPQGSVTGTFDEGVAAPSHTHTQRKQQKDHNPGIFLLSASEAVEKEAVEKEAAATPADPLYQYPVYTYPPTLFSNANYQASCDGMAARDLQFTALTTGSYIFVEGIIIVFSSVALGLAKLLSMCRQGPSGIRKLDDRQRYGANVI